MRRFPTMSVEPPDDGRRDRRREQRRGHHPGRVGLRAPPAGCGNCGTSGTTSVCCRETVIPPRPRAPRRRCGGRGAVRHVVAEGHPVNLKHSIDKREVGVVFILVEPVPAHKARTDRNAPHPGDPSSTPPSACSPSTASHGVSNRQVGRRRRPGQHRGGRLPLRHQGRPRPRHRRARTRNTSNAYARAACSPRMGAGPDSSATGSPASSCPITDHLGLAGHARPGTPASARR